MKTRWMTSGILATMATLVSLSSYAGRGDGSYREAILDQRTRAPYEDALGRQCVAGIIELYQNNENLSSQYIQSTAVNISNYSKRQAKGFPFYHYTNSSELLRLFHPEQSDRASLHGAMKDPNAAFSYSDLLSYQRSAGARGKKIWMQGWGNMEDTVMYAASNPYTSSSYGKNLVTFWFDDQATVYPDSLLKDTSVLKKIAGADRKFSKFLGKCSSGVILAILEESGVDLVDYMSGTDPNAGWFYVISTENIILSDAFAMSEAGSTLQSDEAKNIARINQYLKKHQRQDEITK